MRPLPRKIAILLMVLITPMLLGVDSCDDMEVIEFVRDLVIEVDDLDDRVTALEENCACEGVLAPVCGANGFTYVNACEARCAEVRLAHEGRCEPAECTAGAGDTCEEGSFCDTRPGCQEDAPGMCAVKPELCTSDWNPVCGCDGVTYSNDCARQSAGAGLEHVGECGEPPVRCQNNEGCDADDYCAKPGDTCEGTGICKPRTQLCTLDYRPVCGCDGTTYGNACQAAGAGVSAAHRGECEEPQVPVCHIPAGDWHKRHTIQVGVSAVPAHLGHGDVEGRCPEIDPRD